MKRVLPLLFLVGCSTPIQPPAVDCRYAVDAIDSFNVLDSQDAFDIVDASDAPDARDIPPAVVDVAEVDVPTSIVSSPCNVWVRPRIGMVGDTIEVHGVLFFYQGNSPVAVRLLMGALPAASNERVTPSGTYSQWQLNYEVYAPGHYQVIATQFDPTNARTLCEGMASFDVL